MAAGHFLTISCPTCNTYSSYVLYYTSDHVSTVTDQTWCQISIVTDQTWYCIYSSAWYVWPQIMQPDTSLFLELSLQYP